MELFRFRFADERSSVHECVRVSGHAHTDGEINGLALYFHLHVYDGQPSYSSGPDNPTLVAWSQSLVHLPIPVHVATGEELTLWASRTRESVCVGLLDVPQRALVRAGTSEVLGFSHTEDERWPADLREAGTDAAIMLHDGDESGDEGGKCATLSHGYATAPYAPVHVAREWRPPRG
jgi:hypothetical protein